MGNDANSVSAIVEELSSTAQDNEQITVNDVVKQFGGRSYGPSLLIPALVGLTPVGGVPSMPSFFASLTAVFAAQIVLGRSHFWLPSALADRSVSAEKLKTASKKLQKPARWLDSVFRERLAWATGKPFSRIAAGITLLLCLTVPPLEVVPFAAALPFGAIAAIGLAIMVRDGALMLLAIAVSFVSFGVVLQTLLG